MVGIRRLNYNEPTSAMEINHVSMSLSRPFSWDGVGPSVFSRMFFPRRCKNMERLFNSSFVSNIIGISGPGRKNQGERCYHPSVNLSFSFVLLLYWAPGWIRLLNKVA